jgi:hypothetical protein
MPRIPNLTSTLPAKSTMKFLKKRCRVQIPSQYAGIGSADGNYANRRALYLEWTARRDRIEGGRQHGNAGLIGTRHACAVIPAGIALLQPFPLRIIDIATLSHRHQRRYDAQQCRHTRFRLSKRIVTANRALSRRGRLAAIDRRVVSSPRRNRGGEQAQGDRARCQFSKMIEVQHDDISPRLEGKAASSG